MGNFKITGVIFVGAFIGALLTSLLNLTMHIPFLWTGYQANAPLGAMRSIIIADIVVGIIVGSCLGIPTSLALFFRNEKNLTSVKICLIAATTTFSSLIILVIPVIKILFSSNSMQAVGGTIVLLPMFVVPALWAMGLLIVGIKLRKKSASIRGTAANF